tara:strand:- start:153 stop:320 length:168 start_codon:yes stop_codon:yes gene_type:complete
VFINGADFLKYWVLEKFYDSGYAFGSAGLGTLVLVKDITIRIDALWNGDGSSWFS